MTDPRIYHWLRGGCGNYARALQDAAHEDGAELALGHHASPRGIEHVFAHDDGNAYDALGAHPLPYKIDPTINPQATNWKDQYHSDPNEIESTYPTDEEEIEAALEHAHEIWRDHQTSKMASDFVALLPKQARQDPDPRPLYVLWTFDPQDGKVYIGHNEGRHPADQLTHSELAPHVHHPDRIHGYAYSIVGGWRITDDAHHKVDDPYIIRRVMAAINHEHEPAPLPQIRYHGAP